MIGPSGSGKTPAQKMVERTLAPMLDRFRREHDEALAKHEREEEEYKLDQVAQRSERSRAARRSEQAQMKAQVERARRDADTERLKRVAAASKAKEAGLENGKTRTACAEMTARTKADMAARGVMIKAQTSFPAGGDVPAVATAPALTVLQAAGEAPAITTVEAQPPALHVTEPGLAQVKPGDPPTKQAFLTTDVTVEAMAQLLCRNPRGIVCSVDELNGWLVGMDRYHSGGGDADTWKSWYDHTASHKHRVVSGETSVRQPFVSVVGGTQPSRVADALASDAARAEGMALRFLWAYPATTFPAWTNADISDETFQAVCALWERLRALEPACDAEGNTRPQSIELSGDAKNLYVRFHELATKQMEKPGTTDEHRSLLSKSRSWALRMALIFHCVSEPTGDADKRIGRAHMQAAINLAKWHTREAKRVFALADGTDGRGDGLADDLVKLEECMRSRGGAIVLADIVRGPRCYRGPDGRHKAEADLRELVKQRRATVSYSSQSQRGSKPVATYTLRNAA